MIPTSDQWFDDGQLSAYTELGRLIAQNAVTAAAHYTAKLDARLNGPVYELVD
jgi:hypothetical protein